MNRTRRKQRHTSELSKEEFAILVEVSEYYGLSRSGLVRMLLRREYNKIVKLEQNSVGEKTKELLNNSYTKL